MGELRECTSRARKHSSLRLKFIFFPSLAESQTRKELAHIMCTQWRTGLRIAHLPTMF